MIPGIDVSHWQGAIDWRKVKQAGVKFAFFKLSEKDKYNDIIDDQALANAKGCQENNILYSPYLFYRAWDEEEQVAKFMEGLEIIGGVDTGNTLPPVVDFEVYDTRAEQRLPKLLDLVETETGRRPIIYTSSGTWRQNMVSGFSDTTLPEWADNYLLWTAQYRTGLPDQMYPWATWTFWQYSQTGMLPGVNSKKAVAVDLDWFNGSLYDLARLRYYKGEKKWNS